MPTALGWYYLKCAREGGLGRGLGPPVSLSQLSPGAG
jgi:hypothetical protein